MPYDGPNPYQSDYDTYAAQRKAAYEAAMARIASQRSQFRTQMGFDENGHVLANAPFGQYQQMMQQASGAEEASDAMQRARGFTGGGLSRQAMEAAKRITQQQTYDFGQQYQQGLTQFSDSEAQAGQSYNDDLMAKMEEITQRAIQDQAYNQANYGDTSYPAYGTPNQPNAPAPGAPANSHTPGYLIRHRNGRNFDLSNAKQLKQFRRALKKRGINWNQWLAHHGRVATYLGR